jgi:16S rRNA A1518/A1519 N6-dimethyltransferase RsmA/KsgA/DIM1 with predicted DNA glycosylase/AP lyase activity
MLNEALFVIAFLVLCFGFVVLFGAPYLPTHTAQIDVALDILSLKKGQTLLELGAGDGKVALRALALGLNVVAIEFNPLLCIVIWLRTRAYRGRIKILCGNFWTLRWPDADGIYVFLLDRYMTKLDRRIVKRYEKVRLASYVFQISGKKPDKQREGVFLYKYGS